MFNKFFFLENRAFCDIMWKNIVKSYRPHLTIRLMRIACWIPKVTNTTPEYEICIASTAKMVERRRLTVTLYVHTLPVLFSLYSDCNFQIIITTSNIILLQLILTPGLFLLPEM